MENMSKNVMIMEKLEASDQGTSTSNEAMIETEVDMNDQDLEAGQLQKGSSSGGPHLECRICREEDFIDKLETPCHCNGTLKFAHRDCIQRWINERLSMICEICHQSYEDGYTLVMPPAPDAQSGDVTIGIRDGYFTFTSPAELQAHRAHIEAAAEFIRQQRLQAYNARAYGGSAACRVGAVICIGLYLLFIVGEIAGMLNFRIRSPHPMNCINPWLVCLAFLVVKDIYYLYQNGEESDLFTIFCVMLGFFLPCYILAWFANNWNQNEGELAATEVAVVSQATMMR